MVLRHILIGLMGSALMLAMNPPARAQSSDQAIDDLVQEIIALRNEVSELDSTLSRLKDEHRNRMNALAREEGQLSAERERQQMRVRRLEQSLSDKRDAIAEAGMAGESLQPVLSSALEDLRQYINDGIPFKWDERLGEIDNLASQLEAGAVAPARIANRVWSLITDELRLTGETGLYRQRVTVDGTEKLADVARVGMRQIYFRTENGDVGYATLNDGEWVFRHAPAGERRPVNDYMDALQQQLRTGYFELPGMAETGEFQ